MVGFSLQNTSGAAEGTGYVTFGQVFAKGAVMPGTTLVAKINGQDVAVQMDVKTTNADGSVGHALLTLKAPALAADGSVNGMLAKVAPAPAGAAIQAQDIVSHGLDVKVQVTLHNPDGSTTVKTVDAAQLLQQAINAGTVETWMKGAQASEYRVETTIAPNLDVKLDIRMDALGKLHTDVIFARDDAYTTNLGTLNYDVKITQDGATAFSQANIQQHNYLDLAPRGQQPGRDRAPCRLRHAVSDQHRRHPRLRPHHHHFTHGDRRPDPAAVAGQYRPDGQCPGDAMDTGHRQPPRHRARDRLDGDLSDEPERRCRQGHVRQCRCLGQRAVASDRHQRRSRPRRPAPQPVGSTAAAPAAITAQTPCRSRSKPMRQAGVSMSPTSRH